MNVFDKFIVGQTENIDWVFETTHFNQRLQENGLSREFIVDTVMYEEPLRWDKAGNNEYEVIFKAPETKIYTEIRVIFACEDNTITLVTVMPNEGSGTDRQKNMFKTKEYKDLEKKRLKAINKRKW